MGSAIGQVLPLAIGIAISPAPIIAAILMLLSPRARSTSVGFLLGWVGGIVVGVVLFTALSSVLPKRSGGPSPVVGVIEIVLGAGLLLLAVRQWRSRPAKGTAVELPKWMAAIDSMTAGRALGLGFGLAAVNPKNLLMAIAAGVALGASALPIGQLAAVMIIFAVLAASTVLVPVLAYLLAADRMAGPLSALREWLEANNAAIMAVVLLVLGVAVIGKGLGAF